MPLLKIIFVFFFFKNHAKTYPPCNEKQDFNLEQPYVPIMPTAPEKLMQYLYLLPENRLCRTFHSPHQPSQGWMDPKTAQWGPPIYPFLILNEIDQGQYDIILSLDWPNYLAILPSFLSHRCCLTILVVVQSFWSHLSGHSSGWPSLCTVKTSNWQRWF